LVFLNKSDHIGIIEPVVYFRGHHRLFGLGLQLRGVFGAVSGVVHQNLPFGVLVHTEADCLVLKIVDLVQMSQKNIADEDKVATAALQLVRVDSELASLSLSLMQVELGRQLKHLPADLEADGLDLLLGLITRSHHLAEIVVGDAVEVGDRRLPLLLEHLELVVGNSNVHAAGVDDGSILLLVSWLLALLGAVENVLPFEGPLLD